MDNRYSQSHKWSGSSDMIVINNYLDGVKIDSVIQRAVKKNSANFR